MLPGEDLQTVINQAKAADSGFVLDLTGKLMVNAPEIIIDLASQYLSVEKEELLALSPTELLDVLEAWWELNDLSDFSGASGKDQADASQSVPDTGSWLQRWLAIAETIGISKSELLQDYYYDEFLVVLDEYNELHKFDQKKEDIEEVDAGDW